VPDDVWLYIAGALGVAVAGLVLLLFLERERRKPLSKEVVKPPRTETEVMWPLSAARTITNEIVKETKDKLRILDLDREILSYAVRRLYEAHAEGKITEEERDRMALKYKEDLSRIKEEIARGESVVVLNELERMQEEFVKNFSERFEELNKRIGELRRMVGFKPPELEKLPEEKRREEEAEAPKTDEKAALTRRKKISKPKAPGEPPEPAESAEVAEVAEPEKSEAEKKVEEIMAEVEKVLERLGQMEVEE